MAEQKRKILPLVWLAFALALAAFLHWYSPLLLLLQPPWNWIGLAPAIFGFWMMVVSARQFLKVETGLVPFNEATVLVTGGFFRYTRNPMYLGMVLLLGGIAMLLGSLSPFLPIPFFVLVIQRNFIEGEERFLEDAFGEDYLDYKRKVRRWL
ncbi:MAG: DUF1295 domain-containing protein [Xanthomonadales bacterium]|nr:isoprenylcysteine carboxylmethyltransferase family protein [Xanthomonadales bacterium]NIX13548.1 DUF1295 domain-containing protein [Xanthomonadales bacterium]